MNSVTFLLLIATLSADLEVPSCSYMILGCVRLITAPTTMITLPAVAFDG